MANNAEFKVEMRMGPDGQEYASTELSPLQDGHSKLEKKANASSLNTLMGKMSENGVSEEKLQKYKNMNPVSNGGRRRTRRGKKAQKKTHKGKKSYKKSHKGGKKSKKHGKKHAKKTRRHSRK